MKFKEILEERNLKLEQLPKTTQKKIAELEGIFERLEKYKNSKDLTNSEAKFIDEADAKIQFLQGDIERAILRFNPEVYKKRLEVLDKIHKKGNQISDAEIIEEKEVVEEKAEVSVEEPKLEPQTEIDSKELTNNSDEVLKDLKEKFEELDSIESLNEFDEDDEDVDSDLEEEIYRLKKSVKHIENNTLLPEELKKEGESQPKKMSKGLILMGVGAFLLTWGAVNFFKERRG
jgi:hypothetical protein